MNLLNAPFYPGKGQYLNVNRNLMDAIKVVQHTIQLSLRTFDLTFDFVSFISVSNGKQNLSNRVLNPF